MTDMMKDVTDVKKISNDRKVAICKSYMGMHKDMMKTMTMCNSKDLKDAMGMVQQLCGGGKMGGSGSGGGKKDGDVCDMGLKMVGVYVDACMFMFG